MAVSADTPNQHPPRPRLSIRVGVTGHRWDKLKPDDAGLIRERFDQVFDTIERMVDRIHTQTSSGYRDPGGPSREPLPPLLRLFSGLAEGTDRIAAEASGRRKGKWTLTALLPFGRQTFEHDFKLKKRRANGTAVPFADGEPGYRQPDPESIDEFRKLLARAEQEGGVQELDGTKGTAGGGAYVPLANALCFNSDLVVAVWDDDEAKPGGTGAVVKQAVEYGIPVVRIPLDGRQHAWIHQPGSDPATAGRDANLAALGVHFERLLAAPAPPAGAHAPADVREVYFRETERRGRLGQLYDWCFSLMAPSGRTDPGVAGGSGVSRHDALPATDGDPVARLEARWRREWSTRGACDRLCSALLESGIHRHYGWASHLANYYGGLYRSAFLTNYMFAWLAVAAAAVGVMFHHPEPGPNTVSLIAAAIEVGLLLGIVIIVWRSKHGRYHTRWLDYRRLAELIRSLPMLLPLSRTPVLRVEANPVFATKETWVEWMFRAVMRETGVLPIDVTRHLAGARGILADGILAGQIEYHGRTAIRYADVDRRLHQVTTRIFILALALALIHFTDLALGAMGRSVLPHFLPELRNEVAHWLLLPALVLPALGAALHGLRSQGDYELTAARSARIGGHLAELQKELVRHPNPTVGQVADIATETATAMNAELSAWLQAYQRKGIGLV